MKTTPCSNNRRNDEWKRLVKNTYNHCWKIWNAHDTPKPALIIGKRLRSSLALFDPQNNTIKTHQHLSSLPHKIVREVLIHELAHYVAKIRFGPTIKPHGQEWQTLISRAGIKPRVHIPIGSFAKFSGPEHPPSHKYRHTCPVCHFERYALTPQKKWRCASCVESGLEGHLIIETCFSKTKDEP